MVWIRGHVSLSPCRLLDLYSRLLLPTPASFCFLHPHCTKIPSLSPTTPPCQRSSTICLRHYWCRIRRLWQKNACNKKIEKQNLQHHTWSDSIYARERDQWGWDWGRLGQCCELRALGQDLAIEVIRIQEVKEDSGFGGGSGFLGQCFKARGKDNVGFGGEILGRKIGKDFWGCSSIHF